MEDDKARSEGTFRFNVNVSTLKDYVSVLSPPFYVRNLPWKIMVRVLTRLLPDGQLKEHLSFYLICNGESKSPDWSCYATAELRLLAQKPNTASFYRKISHVFFSKENDWGFWHFIEWDEVIDPGKGFIKDDSITLEVHVTADEPLGISRDCKKHTGYEKKKKKEKKKKNETSPKDNETSPKDNETSPKELQQQGAVMEEDKARSEGTFRFTVHNVSTLKEFGSVSSPPYYVRNLPWKIRVMALPQFLRDGRRKKYLIFDLLCNEESKSTDWLCFATAQLRLLAQKPHTENLYWRIARVFSSKENDWGFRPFMEWNEVIDPEKGFIKDDSITLEMHITAKVPYIVSWDCNKHTGHVEKSPKDNETSTKDVGTSPGDNKISPGDNGISPSDNETSQSKVENIQPNEQQDPSEVTMNVPHYGVTCGACDGPVTGFRYKCLVCDDYDLCGQCEAAGKHSKHCMLRLPTPVIPRDMLKSVLKQTEHVLKSVPTVEENRPHEGEKRERCVDKKHRHDIHVHHHVHNHGRSCSTWPDTFTAYMNQVADLAGDMEYTTPENHTPQVNNQGSNNQGNTPQVNNQGSNTQGNSPQVNNQGSSTQGYTPQVNNQGNPHGNIPMDIINKIIGQENVIQLNQLQKTLHDILMPKINKNNVNTEENNSGDAKASTSYQNVTEYQDKILDKEADMSKNNDRKAESSQIDNDPEDSELQQNITAPKTSGAQDTNAPKNDDIQTNGNIPSESKNQEINNEKRLQELQNAINMIMMKVQTEMVKPTVACTTLTDEIGDKNDNGNENNAENRNEVEDRNDIQDTDNKDINKPQHDTHGNENEDRNATEDNEAKDRNEIGDRNEAVDNFGSVESDSVSSGLDKADEWTMISNENNEYLVAEISPAPSAPLATPSGYSLPAEFAREAGSQQLYPSLHAAAAVLDPLQPEEAMKPETKPNVDRETKPQTVTQPQTSTQPNQEFIRQPHPKPHVEVAIQQMVAMGFKNDNGWLTQLVDTCDGDIAAVLDMLTPVAPRG